MEKRKRRERQAMTAQKNGSNSQTEKKNKIIMKQLHEILHHKKQYKRIM